MDLLKGILRRHCEPGPGTRLVSASSSQKLQILFAVYAAGYLLAAVYYFWHAVYLQMPYPYNSFLSLPVARFTDYDNMILMCRNLNPYHDHSRSGYPPFANFFFYLFSTFSLRYGFFIFVLAPILFSRWAAFHVLAHVSRWERCMAASFLLVFSYPFLFTWDRGNLEFHIMIATGIFFIFYNSPKDGLRDVACLGLAAGIALKVYPVVLLIIPFKDRRYIDCLKVLAFTLLLTLFSAATFSGGAMVAFNDFFHMLNTTGQLVKDQFIYAHGNAGIFYGVSILLKKGHFLSALELFNRVYWLIGGLILLVYCSIISMSRLSYWASCICLVSLMCLVPSLSNDYRTLQLLVPMLLFIRAYTPNSGYYSAIAAGIGLLLVPRNYWLLFPEIEPGDIGIGSVITPLLLFALLNLTLWVESKRWRNARMAPVPSK